MSFLREEKDEFLRKFSSIFRQIIFLVVPMSLLLLILRALIVRVILGAGKFSWANTKLTTACLGILALNLVAQALILFLSKTFYAAHNTKIPAIISGITVSVNIALSLFLVWLIEFLPDFHIFLVNILRLGGVDDIGVVGLVLAYFIGSTLQVSLLLYMFYKKFPKLRTKEILSSLYKILIASLVMVIFTFIVRQLLGSIISLQTFWGIFFQLVVSGIVGISIYGFMAHFLKSQESKAILDSCINKFFYQGKETNGISEFMEAQAGIKRENKQKIVDFLQGKEKITNNDVEKLLLVSNATAERYLNQLEQEGVLKQIGNTGKYVYYKKI
jgi:putative peptidoglycan lipid II flippase